MGAVLCVAQAATSALWIYKATAWSALLFYPSEQVGLLTRLTRRWSKEVKWNGNFSQVTRVKMPVGIKLHRLLNHFGIYCQAWLLTRKIIYSFAFGIFPLRSSLRTCFTRCQKRRGGSTKRRDWCSIRTRSSWTSSVRVRWYLGLLRTCNSIIFVCKATLRVE